MFGLLVGTLCLVALIATLRARHHRHFMPAYGFGWGGGCRAREGLWDDEYRPSHRWRRGGRGGFMYQLFARLDATPGQEKALKALVETLRERLRDARDEFEATRQDLAAVLSADTLDKQLLETCERRQTELFTRFSRDVSATLESAHELLDPHQRRYLAELIAKGPFRSYREW